jgi:1,2-diacylglycerol 3-alpha-glucosyltransferase
MRILIFSNSYKPTVSGVVTSITHFRKGLTDANHEVHVIAPHYLSNRLDLSLVLPFRSLIEPTVRGIKPSLIHSQHPVWMGDLAVAFARDLNLPLVFTYHTRYDEYAQSYLPLIPGLVGGLVEEVVQRYMSHCAHIIAPTPGIRELLKREYQVDTPVTVIPSPVDLDQFNNLNPNRIQVSLGLEESELLLYMGRMGKEKGLDFMLRAFAKIVAMRPSVKLLLVGDGPHKRSLENMAHKLGLSDEIIFSGVIPHEEVPHYIAAADLFVFSSQKDTQGLVLIEAMAAGIPSVAVDAPGPMDVLSDGGGLLVPADEEEFSAVVLSLLEDHERRDAMGRQALQLAQQYSISSTTKLLLGVYEEVIKAEQKNR